MRIKLLSTLAVLAVLGITCTTLLVANTPSAPPSNFYLTDNTQLQSKDLAKKVIVVNFWATSCTTCVAEMPRMAELYQRYKDRGLTFVAVAMSYDSPAYVVKFQRNKKLPFPVAFDKDGELAKSWGDVSLTPTTFLIDKSGRIVKKYIGQPDFNDFAYRIEQLL
ncbi:TlpA family protein disulfide reductase [Curvibacter sp. CHRR-16]|uniref:TlpA disulfide reductase family protein n=1 Tax=Curvibacter sp. CHRR-16 TaxID=2835872 RepID=UPI001BD9A150|nr:TlpA disulfide reductase family protein [Curvibacter sp. CHRR-16]MBT0571839.1 TlpA family protein disulfide reductase [Curvibacter sp. CHRR-16]